MPRESRTKLTKKKDLVKQLDNLIPIDIYQLGSKDDPCFGKLFDLKAEECALCGDSEFCQIALTQNLHVNRAEIAKEVKFLDIEEGELFEKKREIRIKRLKLFIKKLKGLGKSQKIIKTQCIEKFGKYLPEYLIDNYINSK